MPLRVATWNLWWRFGDWGSRASVIEEVLRTTDADVVCLQEVWSQVQGESADHASEGVFLDDGDDASDVVNSQARELAQKLDYPHYRSSWRRAHEGIAFGNAILTRPKILATHTLPLPDGGHPDEFRTALAVTLDQHGHPVHVATTHLNFQWADSDVRQVQVDGISRWLANLRDASAPVVLTGDLNAVDVSDEIRMLTGRTSLPVRGFAFHDAWEVAGEGDGNTWSRTNTHTPHPALESDKRIDYIMVSHPTHDGRGITVNAELIGIDADPIAGHGSDHFGVAADILTSPRPRS